MGGNQQIARANNGLGNALQVKKKKKNRHIFKYLYHLPNGPREVEDAG